MVEIVNRQRRRVLDERDLGGLAERALRALKREAGATLVFVSDRVMRDLNFRFRAKRGTTDVLSFPSGELSFEVGPAGESHLGDVVISVERAARQAAAHELKLEEELRQLILHGLLHLCGYDHETDNGEMNRLELRLRRRLGI